MWVYLNRGGNKIGMDKALVESMLHSKYPETREMAAKVMEYMRDCHGDAGVYIADVNQVRAHALKYRSGLQKFDLFKQEQHEITQN